MVIDTIWLRASDTKSLPGSVFAVIWIVEVLLRMLGEIFACAPVTLGIAGGVALPLVVYSGPHLGIPGVGPLSTLFFHLFVGGTARFASATHLGVGSALLAAVNVLLFYLVAERLSVLTEIARNTAALRAIAEQRSETMSETS